MLVQYLTSSSRVTDLSYVMEAFVGCVPEPGNAHAFATLSAVAAMFTTISFSAPFVEAATSAPTLPPVMFIVSLPVILPVGYLSEDVP